jgi:hypothetical protein
MSSSVTLPDPTTLVSPQRTAAETPRTRVKRTQLVSDEQVEDGNQGQPQGLAKPSYFDLGPRTEKRPRPPEGYYAIPTTIDDSDTKTLLNQYCERALADIITNLAAGVAHGRRAAVEDAFQPARRTLQGGGFKHMAEFVAAMSQAGRRVHELGIAAVRRAEVDEAVCHWERHWGRCLFDCEAAPPGPRRTEALDAWTRVLKRGDPTADDGNGTGKRKKTRLRAGGLTTD